jgi:hypothetical protein
MAKQDFTPALAAAHHEKAVKPLDSDACAMLCTDQLQAIKAVLDSRVMAAVATISDPACQRAAIITTYRRLGADLLAKFSVRDVVDIPSHQFAAAREFLATVAVTSVRMAGARA